MKSKAPTVAHPAALYPRVYRPAPRRRILLLVLCFILGVASAIGVWHFGLGHSPRPLLVAAHLTVVCAVVTLVTGYLAAWMLVARITLWSDRIEARDLIAMNTLSRDEIAGWRPEDPGRYGEAILLIPADPRKRPIRISQLYRCDQSFQQWMSSFSDLDVEDRRASERTITSDKELGENRRERMDAFRRAKRISAWLAGISMAVLFVALFFPWAMFFPRFYRFLILFLILLPWVALGIAARSRELYTIHQKRNDARPNMLFPYLLPGIGLAVRALADVNVLGWRGPLIVAVVLACILGTVALLSGDARIRSRGVVAILLLLALPYGYGAGMQLNTLLDRSTPSQFRAQIIEKHKTVGRGISYDVHLAAWGPHREPDRLSVWPPFYNSVQAGDSVCIALHKGALQVPWYAVGQCPATMRDEP